MDSAIVIKVKYAETLRRFNARILDGELELDMNGMREKIIGLFKFTPDTDFTLTYLDEDGDVVTLGDNEDLHDVVRQGLNPLRITVTMNTDKSSKTYSTSSGSSTPLRSPRVQQLSQNFNSNVSGIFNSVPEPIRRRITKVCTDLASTDTSPAPSLVELFQCLGEIGLPFLKPYTEPQAGPGANVQGGAASGSTTNETSSADAKSGKAEGAVSNVMSSDRYENLSSRSKEVCPNGKSEATPKDMEVKFGSSSGGLKGSVSQFPGLEAVRAALDSVDNVNNLSANGYLNESASLDPKPPSTSQLDFGEKKKVDMSVDSILSWKSAVASSSDAPGVPCVVPGDKKEKAERPDVSTAPKSINVNAFPFPFAPGNMTWCNLDSRPADANVGTRSVFGNSSGSTQLPSPTSECPFAGVPFNPQPIAPPLTSRVVQPRRNQGHWNGSGVIFHRGVCCDGCGVHPITGPRFKSKVKEDYDLCSICFNEIENANDYVRMDRPMTYRHPFSFKGLYDLPSRVQVDPPLSQSKLYRGCGVKQGRPKLDSRFIQDVNILDGTLMAPSVPFTKIWRMRNSGSIVWPQHTQLVWIGGDKLSDAFSAELEITPAGVLVDQELDVAVDFIAPDRPGRYISYWRMASPSGQKFGQRVWVLIQVDASSKELPHESDRGFNLNLPPLVTGVAGPEIINSNPEPMLEDGMPELAKFDRATELVEPIVDLPPEEEHEVNFPINDSLLVGDVASNAVPIQPNTSVSYPVIDLSEIPSCPSPVAAMQSSAQNVVERNKVEETLLKDLDAMGFKQVDLNKEILRLNEYDLEKSVDLLCGVSEWDPMLVELHEMGFFDDDTNKKLLEKNNGSIKRVVMDLLANEK